ALVEDDHGQAYRLVPNALVRVVLPPGVTMRYLRTDPLEGGTRAYALEMSPRRPFWISSAAVRGEKGPFRERPVGVLAPAEDMYVISDTEAELHPERAPHPLLLLGMLALALAILVGL